jgi:hypothetical protein
MDILIRNGFAIDSIEKCMMDYDCNFIEYDDEEAISSRLGSSFIVLKETYFVAHYNHQQVKCDYNCRNRIMKQLIAGNGEVGESHHLEKVNDVIRGKKPPYMLFTNECIRDSRAEDDSIIAEYTTVDNDIDIKSLIEIVKSKQCYQKFFVVHRGDKLYPCNQYFCLHTQHFYGAEYNQFNKCHIIDTFYGDSEDPMEQLQSDCQNQIPVEPLPKLPNFNLMDIEGNPVEENTEYQLEMYDQDMDILEFAETGELFATPCDKQVKPLVVKYSIIDGIHYLTHNNKYLCVADMDWGYSIGVTDQLPSKQQRMFFTITQNNTFVALKWNRRVLLTFTTLKHSYSALEFKLELTFTNCYHPLYVFLKRM